MRTIVAGESVTVEGAWELAGYLPELGVACGACGQQPGEVCLDFHGSADPSRYTKLRQPHPERVEAAAFKASVEAGLGGGQVHEATAAQIDRAVLGRLV